MTSPLIAPNHGAAVSGQTATLLVNEIYASIQGESTYAGRPCVFIRLTGCPLRCVWCDTEYAFAGGDRLALDEILGRARSFGIGLVEVTGGEPLAQPECIPLLAALCDSGFEVLLETGGSINISSVDPRVIKIMDIKCPGSGEEKSNRWENLKLLQPHDEIKFVIRDRADFDWAIRVIRERGISEPRAILFSPVQGELDPRLLAEWMIEKRPPGRLQLQIHKIIWPGIERGV